MFSLSRHYCRKAAYTLVLALLAIFIFIGCEEEELLQEVAIDKKSDVQELTEESTEVASGNKFYDKLEDKETFIAGLAKLRQVKGFVSKKKIEIPMGVVDLDNVVVLENKSGEKRYAFSMLAEDSSIFKFYNYIVKEDATGIIYSDYVLVYTMAPMFAEDFRNNHADFTTFTGNISMYSAKGSVLRSNTRDPEDPCTSDDFVDGDNDGEPSGGDGQLPDGGGSEDDTTGDGYGDEIVDGDPQPGDPDGSGSGGESGLYCETTVEYINCAGSLKDEWHADCSYKSTVADSDKRTVTNCREQSRSVGRLTGDDCPDNSGDTPVNASETLRLKKDCNNLANLANSPSFNMRMAELMANNSGNTEILYHGRKNLEDGTMNYADGDRYESGENEREITPAAPMGKIDSFIHNHSFITEIGEDGNPITLKPLPVFSGADLYTLYNLYVNDKIRDISNFVMVVTTPGQNKDSEADDTVYAVTVSNVDDLATFGAIYLTDPDIVDSMYNIEGSKIRPNLSVSLNEERLSKLLRDNNLGLNLYRGNNNDLRSWKQIKINNDEELEEKTCN